MGEQVVVVGVDGSPASFTGLRWALAHANNIGGQVRAVRCWQPVPAAWWVAAVTGGLLPPSAEQQADAERELAQVVAAARGRTPEAAQVAVQCKVACGPAGPVLVAEADGAAMLVVGRHVHRGIHGLLVGSTSAYCARHANCPVMVITPAIATRRELGVASWSANDPNPLLDVAERKLAAMTGAEQGG